jgi:hypothetical protein
MLAAKVQLQHHKQLQRAPYTARARATISQSAAVTVVSLSFTTSIHLLLLLLPPLLCSGMTNQYHLHVKRSSCCVQVIKEQAPNASVLLARRNVKVPAACPAAQGHTTSSKVAQVNRGLC